MGATIKVNEKLVSCLCLYNPPSKKLNRKILEFANDSGDFLILGDFNIRLEQLDGRGNNSGKVLQEFIDKNEAFILNSPNQPTFFRHHNDETYTSTLDLAIGNAFFQKSLKSNNTIEISPVSRFQNKYYHVPIAFNFSLKISSKKPRSPKHKSFIYDRANWREFKNEIDRKLIDIEHNTELTPPEINDIVSQAIKEAANKTIPKSQPKPKRTDNYPPIIVDLIKYKRLCKYKFYKNRSKSNGDALKQAELEISEAIRELTRKRWNEFLERMGPHPLSTVPFWKRINRLRGKNQSPNIGSLKIDGLTITCNSEKAKVFADRLENVFKNDNNAWFDQTHKKT